MKTTAAKLTHPTFSALTHLCRTGSLQADKRNRKALDELVALGAACWNFNAPGLADATPAAHAILAADVVLPGKRRAS